MKSLLALKNAVSALDCGGITAGGGAALPGDCAAHCEAVAVCGGGTAASRGGAARLWLVAGLRLLAAEGLQSLVSSSLVSSSLVKTDPTPRQRQAAFDSRN